MTQTNPESSTDRWRQKALAYMRANPHIYDEFYRRCCKAKVHQNRQKLGAKTIWEAMRWDFVTGKRWDESYALNNNYTRTFAEQVVEQNPEDFTGFFDFRNTDR